MGARAAGPRRASGRGGIPGPGPRPRHGPGGLEPSQPEPEPRARGCVAPPQRLEEAREAREASRRGESQQREEKEGREESGVERKDQKMEGGGRRGRREKARERGEQIHEEEKRKRAEKGTRKRREWRDGREEWVEQEGGLSPLVNSNTHVRRAKASEFSSNLNSNKGLSLTLQTRWRQEPPLRRSATPASCTLPETCGKPPGEAH